MRVAFLIDGFNLYHSVKEALADGHRPPLKWLNIPSLCHTILRDSSVPRSWTLDAVHYFSALPHFLESRKPGIVSRHKAFLRALENEGAIVHLGQFKNRGPGRGHEEKETDVAIAVQLLELFHTNAADAAFIMTGDTDIMPAIRASRRLFPTKKICFAFPYKRMNNILLPAADHVFRLKPLQYSKHQFPNPVQHADGQLVACPTSWL